MDNTTEDFSPAESIRLIQSMIDTTRQGVFENSRYFLLWGWCTFAATTGQFLLKVVFHSEYHPVVWWIMVPCVLISRYWVWKRKEKRARTYVNETMRYLWAALTLSYFAISMIFVKLGWENCYPFYMVLYGLGTFVSGKILQFRLFVWGGVASFILAGIAIWFQFDYQALFAAAAIFISYIIPGHLFRIKNKNRGYQTAP